jgi:hypothetical protein
MLSTLHMVYADCTSFKQQAEVTQVMCLFLYIHTHMHACIQTYIHAYTVYTDCASFRTRGLSHASNVSLSIHAYTHAYMHAHTYIHARIYILHAHTHTHTHTYTYVHTHEYTDCAAWQAGVQIHESITYVSIHTYIHTHTHTYIHVCIRACKLYTNRKSI